MVFRAKVCSSPMLWTERKEQQIFCGLVLLQGRTISVYYQDTDHRFPFFKALTTRQRGGLWEHRRLCCSLMSKRCSKVHARTGDSNESSAWWAIFDCIHSSELVEKKICALRIIYIWFWAEGIAIVNDFSRCSLNKKLGTLRSVAIVATPPNIRSSSMYYTSNTSQSITTIQSNIPIVITQLIVWSWDSHLWSSVYWVVS